MPPHEGILQLGVQRLDRAIGHAVDRIVNPAQCPQRIDPAQQRYHDDQDHSDGDTEQNHTAGITIDAGFQHDDADQAEHERAQKRGQNVLAGAVLDQQADRARRAVTARRRIGRRQDRQRKRGHRQHGRDQYLQQGIHRFRSDLGGQIGRQGEFQEISRQRGDRPQQGIGGHPHANPAHQPVDFPAYRREIMHGPA